VPWLWVRATFESYSIESALACDRYRYRFNVELSNLECLNLDCRLSNPGLNPESDSENAPRARARVGYINSKSGYCTRYFLVLEVSFWTP
jgi:hypothetical protein